MTTTRSPSSALTSFVVASRYMPVYLALIVLLVVASIWAPATLSRAGLSAVALFGTYLAITALGQMLVIMAGGIDLSVPGTFTLGAIVMVGFGQQTDERIWIAILAAVGLAALVGLVNGIIIGGLKLNALIVTLAVGQVVTGIVNRYHKTFAIQSSVPSGLADWMTVRFLGISRPFWIGVVLTALFIFAFRYTTVGRRFQVVGANPVASLVSGLRVNLNQIAAYVVAAMLYAVAGVLFAALLRNPGVTIGAPYLLGPIAAVVIGGASLTGGLASPLSTWAAAFFLAGLNQMMRVMGLPTALQFVVFGLVIIGGMLVSGDRIIKGVEQVLRERRRPTRIEKPAKKSSIDGPG
ncbi:MAG: ABC transporter permease [Acidimicrobiia bacterium]|nr:ABC transporter permease [Acidimicrobiia bacterium]MDH5504443.1 ABC transporter permease [Acidimicrobiia bacterium]